jgi:hypothetical protein
MSPWDGPAVWRPKEIPNRALVGLEATSTSLPGSFAEAACDLPTCHNRRTTGHQIFQQSAAAVTVTSNVDEFGQGIPACRTPAAFLAWNRREGLFTWILMLAKSGSSGRPLSLHLNRRVGDMHLSVLSASVNEPSRADLRRTDMVGIALFSWRDESLPRASGASLSHTPLTKPSRPLQNAQYPASARLVQLKPVFT